MGDGKGGVVTTVKEEITKDMDVVKELVQNMDEGGGAKPPDGGEKPPDKKDGGEKPPAVKIEIDEDDQDFYNSLTPEQQAKARRFFKDSRNLRKEVRELRNDVRDIARRPAGEKKIEGEPEPVKARAPQTLEELGPMPTYPDATGWKGTQKEFDKAYEDADEARYQWRRAKERIEAAADEAAKRDAKAIADFNEAQAKFIETHSDYQELVDNGEPLSDIMFGAVLKKGPALLYHWAQNRDEARKIYALGNTQEAVEAVIETWVEIKNAAKKKEDKKEDPPPPKPAKEKPEDPPSPVGGRAAAPVVKDPSKGTFKEREAAIYRQNPGRFKYKPG